MIFTLPGQSKFQILKLILILSLLVPNTVYIDKLLSLIVIGLGLILKYKLYGIWINPKFYKIKLLLFLSVFLFIFFKDLNINSKLLIPIIVLLFGVFQTFYDLKKLTRIDRSLAHPTTYLRVIPALFVWLGVFFRTKEELFFNIICLFTGLIYLLYENFSHSD